MRHVVVGDHVSFFGGWGVDGLVEATALSMLHPTLLVPTSVYLLVLRHPVVVARQLSTRAPGRLVLGVGIGGKDRDEVRACVVNPSTRGRGGRDRTVRRRLGSRHDRVWCGLGDDRLSATAAVSRAVEGLYGLPSERFARYVPCGTPGDVAESLRGYVDAGCRTFNLLAQSAEPSTIPAAVGEVRRLLVGA